MSPRHLAAGVVAAALGYLAVHLAGGPAGAVLAIVGGLLVGAVAARREAHQVRRLARRVGSWVGRAGQEPLRLREEGAWRELANALNTLGTAYHHSRTVLAHERPWRRQLVDSLVEPALLFSADGRLLAANDDARELLGIEVDAGAVGLQEALGSIELADAVEQARTRRVATTVDVEHAQRQLRAVASLVGDQTLVIIADRTQQRRVEELRRNFVVNASHELKTPVTSIQTLAEALAVTVRSDQERTAQLVERLEVEAARLARLLGDLLDLRRLEEHGPLERTRVDLAELVRQGVAELRSSAEHAGVEVSLALPDHAIISGVPADLELITTNLVGNAIQYNRPGGTVRVELETGGRDHLLRVVDTGIGIPEDERARIFERFYRVDTARSRETGGTGLGLSLVRHAVERHGGRIDVQSSPGDGTTFTVVFPADPPA